MGRKTKYNKNEILHYIIEYKKVNDGCSPGYRDICDALKINSTSTVMRYLKELHNEGKITIGNGDRSIRVAGGSWNILYHGIEDWVKYG